MVNYKVNVKFKEASISLNEIITKVLKIELTNMYYVSGCYLNQDLPCNHPHYSQLEGNSN